MRKLIFLVLIVAAFTSAQAQMNFNGQLMYGNEWFETGKTYIKVFVDEDGIYKLSYDDLLDAGVPVNQINGQDLMIQYFGNEIPIHTTNEGRWSSSDYLLFYGKRNDGELDKQMYSDWENEQLNPFYSLFTNESVYYLSWDSSSAHARYQIIGNNLNGPLPDRSEFYMHKERAVYSDVAWAPTAPEEPDSEYSNFIVTEGFGNKMTNSHRLNFPVTDIYIFTSKKPTVKFRTGSNSLFNHFITMIFNDTYLGDEQYAGNKIKEYEYEMKLADLKTNSQLKIDGRDVTDNVIVGYAEVNYPRWTYADNEDHFMFHLESSNQERYFEIEEFTGGAQNYLFDLVNGTVLTPEYENSTARFLVPAILDSTQMWLVNAETSLKSALRFEPYTFQSIDNINPEFLIISSRLLNNSDSLGGVNPIQEYANYRASAEGGGYETAILDVEDLFDHFSYGIDNHSFAIKNFAMYVKDIWDKFEMTFIVGKGLSYINRNKQTNFTSYVPSWGKPGSDNLMFAEGDFSYPYVGVGRLAAHDGQDVMNYLDKARQHDLIFDVSNKTIEERKWLKNILHLSGGDIRIQDQIFFNLESMRGIIENNAFGAKVSTYTKTSTDPVQTSLSQSIIDLIDEGLSIMTFFGHSSAGTFDFSIEDPSKYNNEGRYPIVLSLGCHSGDIHENVYSLSEDFILTKNKGAIAFIASSGNAFITPLGNYGKGVYSEAGDSLYGQPIGKIIRDVLEDQYNALNVRTITLHQQNTLHGDPAVRLYNAPAPDYVVDFASISANSSAGTIAPYIPISFDILNLGAGVKDSIDCYLVHEYGQRQFDTMYFRAEAPLHTSTVNLQMPNPGPPALGKNLVNIVLDYNNSITEAPNPIAEENNELKKAYNNNGYTFFIFDNSVFPVYPREFAIVHDQGVTLRASSSNAFGPPEYFYMEMDTTELFNSPALMQTEVLAYPGLIRWTPGVTLEDETVYYWRVAPKNNNGTSKWNKSSFVYLENGSEGWNQSHAYQWTKDDYRNYEYSVDDRIFQFAEDLKEIRVKNGTFRATRPSISYQNSKSEYIEFDLHIKAGLYISSFDGDTGLPMTNEVPALYDSYFSSPWAEDWMNFPYNTYNKAERAKAINFIENVVPDGNYVVIYTIQNSDLNRDYEPYEWESDGSNGDPDLKTLLEGYGAQRIDDLVANPTPYIFVFKKNDNSFTPIEVVAPTVSDEIDAEFKILGRWFEGDVTSTTVGPAVEWNNLLWEVGDYNPQQDTFRLDIYGVRNDGSEELLFEDIQQFNFDLTSVDPDTYPRLKLNFFAIDDISRNSAQLAHWRVMYKEKPELVLNVNEKFDFNSDTLFLGKDLALSTLATNITNTAMDSLLVKYTIVDEFNEEINIYERLAPIGGLESLGIDFTHPTNDLLGLNQFRVEINPDMDQDEQHTFNNIGALDFTVLGDKLNPILDVTFDGVRIMDGDFVSPYTLISITVKDENEFLFIEDISHFDLALRKLPDPQADPIDLNQSNVTFYPADSTNGNLARLELAGNFESGDYVLYVQATDASGNLSGDQEMEIRFSVNEESQVSSVLNYPNPFSISTEFVFTLTGQEVPDIFTIQIMALSGKVVREITRDELGDLRLGLNRSAYKWNGTDESGNYLPNGIYLYRVLTSNNGEMFNHMNNAALDNYFRNGFGKLVIMR